MVLLGIHSDADNAKGEAAVKELGMTWPIALDPKSGMMSAFNCDSFPDYCVIDRKGNVRFCDLANGDVDKAVEALLKEKP